MSLTIIQQTINKAALTINLGDQILGNNILSAEIPHDREDVIKLCPMASHLFNAINSDQGLGGGALQNVAFSRVKNSDRVTLSLHSDARTRILQWNPQSSEVAAALITETLSNPIHADQLAMMTDITYKPYTPTNKNERLVCDAVYEALAPKTNRDGGSMTILSVAFEEKRGGLFGRGDTYNAATVTVKATGTCGGCSSESITFAMGKKVANGNLESEIQVEKIISHPQASKLLVMLAP